MDFPFADAPGIIRAYQKDSFVQNDLFTRIRELIQNLRGVRFTHNWSAQIQSFSTFLYLSLTSLLGSRTLGEEYTDIFYLTPDRKIPSQTRIGLYVLSSGLAPLIIPKLSLVVRKYLRHILVYLYSRNKGSGDKPADKDTNHETDEDEEDEDEEADILDEYLSPATVISINLAIFYFSGAYYQISKRVLGLRYAFGHTVDPMSQPNASYELIGLLMIARALFKLTTRVRSHIPAAKVQIEEPGASHESAICLEDNTVLPFIQGQSRKCNLCLEYISAPTATLCGHIYCWECIAGWCRDQSECPLCRQECHEQHLLCLRP